MSLEEILIERISNNGPMTITDFMEQALTHPEHGYYMRADPFGVNGLTECGAGGTPSDFACSAVLILLSPIILPQRTIYMCVCI